MVAMLRAAALRVGVFLLPVMCLLPAPGGGATDAAPTYRRLCAQCHGEDGDGLFYANVVPLAGIARRYPPERIGQLSGAFSGRLLQGRELDAMVAYMSSLRGEKGFADPGWIVTPYFVEKKAPRLTEVRLLDTRSASAFSRGHIPNAVNVVAGACIEPPQRTRDWLAYHNIGPETLVIAVDETGGPDAACLWWKLRRAGHPFAVVMDGGMRRYASEQRQSTGPIGAIADSRKGATPPHAWDWRSAMNASGFRPQDELQMLTAAYGYTVGTRMPWTGGEPELAHLVLTLHLLGYEPRYDERTAAVSVAAPVR